MYTKLVDFPIGTGEGGRLDPRVQRGEGQTQRETHL